MKKLLLCSLVLVPFFLFQCSSTNDSIVSAEGKTTESVEIAIAIPEGLDTLISRAVVSITADDMDAIKSDLTVGPDSVYGKVENIPVGKNRLFVVSMFDPNALCAYRGSTTVDIKQGINYVQIKLKSPGAVAVISGTFDDPVTDTGNVPGSELSYSHHTVIWERDIAHEKATVSMSVVIGRNAHYDTKKGPNLFRYHYALVDTDSYEMIDSVPLTETDYRFDTDIWELSFNQNLSLFLYIQNIENPNIVHSEIINIKIEDGYLYVDGEMGLVTDTLGAELYNLNDSLSMSIFSPADEFEIWAERQVCKQNFTECDKETYHKKYTSDSNDAIIKPGDFRAVFYADKMFGEVDDDNLEAGKIVVKVAHTHFEGQSH